MWPCNVMYTNDKLCYRFKSVYNDMILALMTHVQYKKEDDHNTTRIWNGKISNVSIFFWSSVLKCPFHGRLNKINLKTEHLQEGSFIVHSKLRIQYLLCNILGKSKSYTTSTSVTQHKSNVYTMSAFFAWSHAQGRDTLMMKTQHKCWFEVTFLPKC